MDHHPWLVGISLLKIASLSLYVSRLPLIMTGSYFIFLGLELQGVKGCMCRQSLLGCFASFIRNSESEPLPTRGIMVLGGGAVKSLRVVRCLGISLRLVTRFEVAVCVFACYSFGRKKTQHDSLKTSSLWPLRYCLNMVVMHLAV